jgi:hypothetical protein
MFSTKQWLYNSDEHVKKWLQYMGDSAGRFQNVLDYAFSAAHGQDPPAPSLLGDLQAIVREVYTGGTRLYKKGQHALVVQSLSSGFSLAESYLKFVLGNPQNAEIIATAHNNLKVDAIASLLAFSLHQVGDVSQARAYHGYTILYASDTLAISRNGAVGKYVNAVVQEVELSGDRRSDGPLVEKGRQRSSALRRSAVVHRI